jgi:hypothetical protein
MLLTTSITRGAPRGLFRVFGGTPFALEFCEKVVEQSLGHADWRERPDQYCVQPPTEMIAVGPHVGIAVHLADVVCGGMEPEGVYNAFNCLYGLVTETVYRGMAGSDIVVPTSVSLSVDRPIFSAPSRDGSPRHKTTLLTGMTYWVSANQIGW